MTTETKPHWLAAPAPIRRLFRRFPLHTYDAEPLPQRAPHQVSTSTSSSSETSASSRPRLYIFAHDLDAARGLPSFNPACLKWQAFLRIARVDVDLVPSNNHASPSGSLPFLIPPPTRGLPTNTGTGPSVSAVDAQKPAESGHAGRPLTGNGLYQYTLKRAPDFTDDNPSPRKEAYRALLTQNIRPAWLYALYLHPSSQRLLTSLYLHDTPTLVRIANLHSLRAAATTQVLQTTRHAHLEPLQLLRLADDAFSALSALLDASGPDWFFSAGDRSSGNKEKGEGTTRVEPGMFDAEVFAYTWLIMTLGEQEPDKRRGETSGVGHTVGRDKTGLDELRDVLMKYPILMDHAQRLYSSYWEMGRTQDDP